MGEYLSSHRLRHGELTVLSRVIDRSTRTLRTWKRRAGASGLPGHPPHDELARARARTEVERVWHELPRGHDGSGSVIAQFRRLGIVVPTRLVQECVRDLKRERRQREQARLEENRVHVDALARDALWALDQSHLGRDEHGAVRALVVRECCVPLTLAVSVGPPARGTDVVRLLEHAAAERGRWPHVLMLDNGGENRNEEVELRMRREHVIVLWNEPRTPQHNARIERTIGSLKRASGLDAASLAKREAAQGPLSPPDTSVARTRTSLGEKLLRAWKQLDQDTPRVGLGGLTPAEFDSQAPRAEDLIRRARFYEELCEELQRIALMPIRKRARRKLARKATWCALERHGLVTRTRGGRPIPTAKAEGDS